MVSYRFAGAVMCLLFCINESSGASLGKSVEGEALKTHMPMVIGLAAEHPFAAMKLEDIKHILENPKVQAMMAKELKSIEDSPIFKKMEEIIKDVVQDIKTVANSSDTKKIEQEVAEERALLKSEREKLAQAIKYGKQEVIKKIEAVKNSPIVKEIKEKVAEKVKAFENNPKVKEIEQKVSEDITKVEALRKNGTLLETIEKDGAKVAKALEGRAAAVVEKLEKNPKVQKLMKKLKQRLTEAEEREREEEEEIGEFLENAKEKLSKMMASKGEETAIEQEGSSDDEGDEENENGEEDDNDDDHWFISNGHGIGSYAHAVG